MQRNHDLFRQQQAQLAQGARRSAAMNPLASKNCRHRLRATLWSITGWRARQREDAAVGCRGRDH
jgi:hypothetical protein